MLPIEGCEACGGVWLGPDGAVHILRGLGDELEHEIARASTIVEARAAARPSDAGERSCPTCAQTMGRLTVGRTVVDSCPAHGTWFDREEVSAVVRQCGALRRARANEEPLPGDEAFHAPHADERPNTHNPVWEVFVDLILSLVK